MSEPRRVFVDANVLVSTWATDVLLTLAEQGQFEPYWSSSVLAEADAALLRMGRPEKWVRKYLDEICKAFYYAEVEVEVNGTDLVGIELPDPNDRHVVAGAKAAKCTEVVTYNLKDFPEAALAPHGMRAIHPDALLMELAEAGPERVMVAMRQLVATKRHPPRSMAEEIAGLRANMLKRYADFVEKRSNPSE